jgi:hypothetical protein
MAAKKKSKGKEKYEPPWMEKKEMKGKKKTKKGKK